MGLIKNGIDFGISSLTRPLRVLGIKVGKGPTGIKALTEGLTAPIKHVQKDFKSLGDGSGLQIG